ncbi:MAG: PAS domain S-box protein [Methanomassiliicoccales archaeon]|jgi:PAS domain S-box-containing protein
MASIKVLYVDDEPNLRDIVKIFLEQSGEIKLEAVPSVLEAEQALLVDRYDAIISDYQMPEMTGIEFLKRLRSKNNNIPFILFTGRGREEVVIEALNSGADFYMQKSGSPQAQFAELEHYIMQGVKKNRTEIAKLESEEHFRILVENSFEGIAVHIDGKLVETNNALSGITGYPKDELIGKSISDLLTPESWKEMREKLMLPFAKPYDVQVVRKDGQIISAQTRGKNLIWNGQHARLGTIFEITDRKKMEEKLQNSEKKYRTIIETSPDIIWEIDRTGNFTYISPRIIDVLGYSQEEMIGRPIFSLTTTRSTQQAREHFCAHMKTPENFDTFEVSVNHKNGTLSTIELSLGPFLDEEGHLVGFRGNARDVTERTRAEKALKKSEQRFKNLFDASPLGIKLYDKDGLLVDTNPAGISFLEHTDVENIVGTNLFNDPNINQENRSSLRQGRLVQFELFNNSKKNLERISGPAVKNEIARLDVTVIPLFDETTSLNGYEMQIRNTSESPLMMEQEKETSALLSAILESSPDVIVFALDNEYRYTAFNKMHQDTMKVIWGKEISIGTSMLDIIGTEEDRQKARANFDRALSGKSFTLTEEYGDEALKRLTWQDYYAPIMADDREIIGMTCYCLNVTERERAKYELQDANNKLRIISSITRHDMLNKLTVLHGYLELEMRKAVDKRSLDHFGKMVQIAQNLENQINFTKEYQDIGSLRPAWQSLNDVCLQAREQLDHGQVDVLLELDGLELLADPMLKKVFYNLMDNSMKHGHHVRTIKIGKEIADGGMRIVYQDDGIGIAAKDKEKLFIEGSSKNHGLGLFLAKEILKITDITIQETGEPGKGARFEMKVPTGKYRFGD